MNAMQKAALLTLLPTMHKINSTECMFAFQEAFDVHLDHHEFAYYLDELRTKELLDHKGIDTCGRNEYTLNKPFVYEDTEWYKEAEARGWGDNLP